jgi:hypothetical protein
MNSYAIFLGIGIPTCILFYGAAVLFFKVKTMCSFLQLLGAGCLMAVVLAHLFEMIHLLSWMHWGAPDSIGHYVDFGSAVLGLAMFPAGYLCHALTKRRGSSRF